MVFCEKCARLPSPDGEANGGQGWQPVKEKDLPMVLPEIKDFMPTDNGESPLAKAR